MANKSLFSSIKSLLPREHAQRGGRSCVRAGAEACAGAGRGDGLLQRHVLRDGREPARRSSRR